MVAAVAAAACAGGGLQVQKVCEGSNGGASAGAPASLEMCTFAVQWRGLVE